MCRRHSWGNWNDSGNTKIQHNIGLRHFCKADAGGPSVFPQFAQIGRNCDTLPLWLTMFSGRRPTYGALPVTSLCPPLMWESAYVPFVLSRSTGLRPADKSPVNSRRPSLSIQPAAAYICLPVRVLFPGGCRFPYASLRAGNRVVPTALLYKHLGSL